MLVLKEKKKKSRFDFSERLGRSDAVGGRWRMLLAINWLIRLASLIIDT